MMLTFVIRVLSALCFVTTASHAVPLLTKPGCQEECGNVSIPYPFGIGSKCSANSSFTVICQNSTIPQRPLLRSINMEVLSISLYGTVMVNLPVSPENCSQGTRTESMSISLKGGPFFISAHYNSLVVIGCKNSVWLRPNATTIAGCMAVCNANSTNTACNGINCCQTSIPTRLQELRYTYQSIGASNNSFCGYVFPAGNNWLHNKGLKRYEGLMSDPSNPFDREFEYAPLVLEWAYEIGANSSISFCTYHRHVSITLAYPHGFPYNFEYLYDTFCSRYSLGYSEGCRSLLDKYEDEYRYAFYYNAYDYGSSSKYCTCEYGFEGNPYIAKGCTDIDECRDAALNDCSSHNTTCVNTEGSFRCDYNNGVIYGYDNLLSLISPKYQLNLAPN